MRRLSFAALAILSLASAGRAQTTAVPGVYSVRDYGAKGDGTTNDTAAIQSALNAANTAGGGTVYLPKGTYIVKPTTTTGINIYSNVTLAGDGTASTIKVAPNTGNWFRLFRAADGSDLVQNFTMRDLAVDGNAVGNTGCDVQKNDLNNQIIMHLNTFKNITVENCTFIHSGIDAIVLAGQGRATAKGVVISNNIFHWTPAASTDPYFDNSAIYIYAQSQRVTGNQFTEAAAATRSLSSQAARAAIETHHGPAVVSGNVSVGYETFDNVCSAHDEGGVDVETNGIVISGNTIYQAEVAIMLWPYTGYTLRGVTVSNNTIYINNKTRKSHWVIGVGVTIDSACTAGVLDGANIVGNTINFERDLTGTAMSGADSSGAIMLGGASDVTNVVVANNVIENAPAVGIKMGGVPARTYSNIQVLDNTITDAGQDAALFDSQYRSAIVMAYGIFADVTVAHNYITDTHATTKCGLNYVWFATTSATNTAFRDNFVSDHATGTNPHLVSVGTPGGVLFNCIGAAGSSATSSFNVNVSPDRNAVSGGTALFRNAQSGVGKTRVVIRNGDGQDAATNPLEVQSADGSAALFAVGKDGAITAPRLKVTTGAGAGKVLTSDASGNATWQQPTASAGGSVSLDGVALTAATNQFTNPQLIDAPGSVGLTAGGLGTNYSATGLYGLSGSGNGVRGDSAGTGLAGVYGLNATTGGIGVFGSAPGASGSIGVRGQSAAGTGLQGDSANGTGVSTSTATGKSAVFNQTGASSDNPAVSILRTGTGTGSSLYIYDTTGNGDLINAGTGSTFASRFQVSSTGLITTGGWLRGSATVDFDAVLPDASGERVISMPGAKPSMIAQVAPVAGLEPGLMWSACITTNDMVTIRLANVTSKTIKPLPQRWQIACF